MCGVKLLKLGECVVANEAAPVGDAFDRVVVETDEMAVRRFAQVGFDMSNAQVGRRAKRKERVLRPTLRAAAVCKRKGRGRAEIGMRHESPRSIAPIAPPRAHGIWCGSVCLRWM